MKNYGITMEGGFINEKASGLPSHTSEDEARLLYNTVSKQLHLGDDSAWHLLGKSGDFGTAVTGFSDNDPLTTNNVYLVDTTSSSLTGILPATPTDGMALTIVDIKGQFKTNNFIISGNGNNINGSATLTLDRTDMFCSLLYIGADGWKADIGGTLSSISGNSSSTGGVGNVLHKTAAYTALDNDFIFCDTTSAAFTITLPSTGLVDGSSVSVYDQKGQFSDNNLTVNGAGNDIIGKSTLAINSKYARVDFIWDTGTSEWKTDYSNASSNRVNVIDISANYSAKIDDFIFCDTFSGAYTVTLPTSGNLQNNSRITIFDQKNTFESYNLTVVPSDGTINGEASLVCDNNGLRVDFIWDYENGDWKLDFGGSLVTDASAVDMSYRNWLIKTADFNIVEKEKYIVDTSSAVITATLPPSSVDGKSVRIADGGNFNTNNLIIERNGNTIEGVTENMTVATENMSFELVFYNNNWILA